MSATSNPENNDVKQITDDISTTKVENAVDMEKLAQLKAKSQSKQEEKNMAAKIVAKKERSLSLGIVGSGQGGGKLSACFAGLGYDAVAMNTAMQDLKSVNLPDSNKLLLDFTLGGAAKDLELGKQAAQANRAAIKELIHQKLGHTQMFVLCFSLGGGSGAGSSEVLVDILNEFDKPIMVVSVLPMNSEDTQTKQNSLETLAKLSKLTKEKKIANLVVVDNAKIETIYHDVNQIDFFDVANKAIATPLDAFNTFSTMSSPTKPLDSMELAKLFTDGEGLSVYGELTVKNFEEPTALAEAVINSLDANLLSSSFDLKQSRYVGVMFAANKTVWKSIPRSSFDYAMHMVGDQCATPKAIFSGSYVVDDIQENVVKVYTFFTGLGLPTERVEQLKKDAKSNMQNAKAKDEARNLTLNLDTGVNETVSQAQKIKEQIAAKGSTFGKFTKNIIDRRK